MTQKDTNPFIYSDSNKRYHTYDYYLKHRFGSKCAKISLDAGFTCPNIDGTVGTGGCIYCSGGSSGAQCAGTLKDQYDAGVAVAKRKWECEKYIPYLQAHTNTYADIDVLRKTYNEVAEFQGAVMLAIATRADCLDDAVVSLITEMSHKIPIMVELGLQSVKDETAELIGRGHSYKTFLEGYSKLKQAGGDISIGIHLINGLPGETEEDMINNARIVGQLMPEMIKIHLLHVLKNTRLAEIYINGDYQPMSMDRYVDVVVNQLELLPKEIVIGRITGDGIDSELLAPEWSKKKTMVANEIDKLQYKRGTYQGKLLEK